VSEARTPGPLRVPIEPRYADYDTKGHVNNAVYLTYFEMARSKAWVDVMEGPLDFPFVMAEARVRYVSQAMVGDVLEIEIETIEIRNRAWVWKYTLIDPRDERLVASGETVQVMFDYGTRRAIAIPDDLRSRLARLTRDPMVGASVQT